jgi:hypothetical protein
MIVETVYVLNYYALSYIDRKCCERLGSVTYKILSIVVIVKSNHILTLVYNGANLSMVSWHGERTPHSKNNCLRFCIVLSGPTRTGFVAPSRRRRTLGMVDPGSGRPWKWGTLGMAYPNR